MVDYIGRKEIAALSSRRGVPCVSIYLPTFRRGRQVEQNAKRFKNLLRQARNKLAQTELRPQAIEKTLKPAQQLLLNSPFWQHQADGLALFARHDSLDYFRLPVAFDELVVAADRFHLKPLLSLLAADGQFYVLALSKKQAQLFLGSRFALSELDPPRMPKSLADVLRYDVFEKQTQFHTGTPSRGKGRREAVFFGAGDAETDEKEQLRRFFRKLDKSLHPVLAGERSPLILAGVEYMLPIYRSVNEYSLLLDEQVTGSPSGKPASWLHERA
jgi:hypothetical protein